MYGYCEERGLKKKRRNLTQRLNIFGVPCQKRCSRVFAGSGAEYGGVNDHLAGLLLRCKALRGWDFGFNDSVGALRHAFKAILYFRFSGGVLAATFDPVRAKLEMKGT